MPETFGRYRLEEKLGQGGMGIVYRAFDTLLERVIALKMVLTTEGLDPDLRERFFREARAAAHLSHRNIVTIYDLGEHDGRPYLAMEYLDGEDLQRRLARTERMSLSRKLEIASEICQGIEFAHAHGIVHRDLKPANIFVTATGGVKILDFGLARLMTSQLTQSNQLMGTLNYMAPEQVRGERADQQSDVFSIGVVLYELFGGRRAFEGDSVASTLYKILQESPEPLSKIDAGLPKELTLVVDRALAKLRDERYPDMASLRRDLEMCRQSVPVTPTFTPRPDDLALLPTMPVDRSAVPASAPSARPSQPAARRSRAVWLGGAAALVVMIVLGWTLMRSTLPQSSQLPTSMAPSMASSTAPSATTATAAAPTATAAPPAAPAPAVPAPTREPVPETTSPPAAPGAAPPAETSTGRDTHDSRATSEAKRHAGRSENQPATPATQRSRGTQTAVSAPPPNPHAPSGPPQTGASQSAAPQPTLAAPPPAPPTVSAGSPAGGAPFGASAPAPSSPTPAPAPPPSVTAPPTAAADVSSPEQRVADLVARYRSALQSKSLEQLKHIWPTLSGGAEQAMRQEFQHADQIDVEIVNPQVSITGNEGRVTFVRKYSLVTTDGQRLQSSSQTTMQVRRTGTGWVIDNIRFSR